MTLVCVGRMTREKGHRDLLEALVLSETRWPEGLPPLCLWLIGDGPLRRDLSQFWASQQSRHDVQFWGHQTNAVAAIKQADALVLPSRFEGMPNVVLEAMALGTPVIATRAGGTTELEGDEPTLLWSQPGQPDSLADALIAFASDPKAAQQRVESALRLVARHHDVRGAIDRIEQLLSSEDSTE